MYFRKAEVLQGKSQLVRHELLLLITDATNHRGQTIPKFVILPSY